ncbi:MAG: cupin domain-containing protein [Methylovirgula sp.]
MLAQIRLTGDRVYSCSLVQEGHLELEADTGHVCVVTEGALRIESDERGPLVIDKGELVMLPRGVGDLRLAASGAPATMVLCASGSTPTAFEAWSPPYPIAFTFDGRTARRLAQKGMCIFS